MTVTIKHRRNTVGMYASADVATTLLLTSKLVGFSFVIYFTPLMSYTSFTALPSLTGTFYYNISSAILAICNMSDLQKDTFFKEAIKRIGVARGALGERASSRAEKKFGAKFTGKIFSAPQAERAPPGRAKVQFLTKLGRSGRWEWLIQ